MIENRCFIWVILGLTHDEGFLARLTLCSIVEAIGSLVHRLVESHFDERAQGDFGVGRWP